LGTLRRRRRAPTYGEFRDGVRASEAVAPSCPPQEGSAEAATPYNQIDRQCQLTALLASWFGSCYIRQAVSARPTKATDLNSRTQLR